LLVAVGQSRRHGASRANVGEPVATLYSAVLPEINSKGKDARFKKPDRGHFAAK
jgi:hypothetical protein